MDPNANLDEQRRLARNALEIQNNCSDMGEYTDEQTENLSRIATRLAELVIALDEWITDGRGLLPEAWVPDWRYKK